MSAPETGYALFLITYPYIAHCMGACSARGEWSLFSLLNSLSSLSPLYTVLPIVHRARFFSGPRMETLPSSRTTYRGTSLIKNAPP